MGGPRLVSLPPPQIVDANKDLHLRPLQSHLLAFLALLPGTHHGSNVLPVLLCRGHLAKSVGHVGFQHRGAEVEQRCCLLADDILRNRDHTVTSGGGHTAYTAVPSLQFGVQQQHPALQGTARQGRPRGLSQARTKVTQQLLPPP